jgi:hypothetical protein
MDNFKRKKRSWIFLVLFILGFFMTAIFIGNQTNLFYKNSDFDINAVFDSKVEGDSGYLTLQRNQLTPSTLDWASFKNNETYIYFSEPLVKEKIYIDMPSEMEVGQYFINVEVKYLSGLTEIKEIPFSVICCASS